MPSLLFCHISYQYVLLPHPITTPYQTTLSNHFTAQPTPLIIILSAVHRYPGNYARYLELREARLIAEDAESDRARTKLRRESEWMAKQPRARQAKSKARQYQFYELVEAAKGRGPEKKKIDLQSTEEKEKQKRLGDSPLHLPPPPLNYSLLI